MLRICTWNMRRATQHSDAAWEYLLELDPHVALLQEIASIPAKVAARYALLMRRASGKAGQPQRFSTAVLVRGIIQEEIRLSSRHDWVNSELQRFSGNLVPAEIVLQSDDRARVMSVYSPAWPIDRARLKGIDVSQIKLKNNPDVWVTELMWASLNERRLNSVPWVVGGDLNSSVTFDTLWGDGPRGNQEVQDRMSALGFVECLCLSQGQLTPTFRNTKGGKAIHQMDHLFVQEPLASRLATCCVGDQDVVFGGSLSDHLPIIADFRAAGCS